MGHRSWSNNDGGAMEAFELDEVAAERRRAGEEYLQFLNAGSLSVGLYVLPAGGEDTQQPHAEDEVYYVVGGRATVRVGEEDRPVGPGSLVFVGAGVPHRFHGIAEELSLLVVFAPEHVRAAG
jgi:mannose-6-phosphate isomerase-like protein (cupin superfamily)